MEALLFGTLAFCLTLIMVRGVIGIAGRHGLGMDSIVGVQKFHVAPVPRLGGACIVATMLVALLIDSLLTGAWAYKTLALLLCVSPLVAIGLVEDFTRAAGVLPRLLLAMFGAALAWWLLDARIPYVHVPGFDAIFMAGGVLAFFFTIVAVAGVVHAFNMIDGINGLAGFVALTALVALAVVAFQVGDALVFRVAAITAGAMLGFLLWNFPGGRIFLGDTGSYVAGFLTALLIILLVARNPSVSPWFGMALVAYPVWEMFFSMWRRGVIQRAPLGNPDRLHLHQLVYRRLVPASSGICDGDDHRDCLRRHTRTALYFWVPVSGMAVLAVAQYDNTPVLMGACLAFALTYCLVYRRIVRFNTPRLLVVRGNNKASDTTDESAVTKTL